MEAVDDNKDVGYTLYLREQYQVDSPSQLDTVLYAPLLDDQTGDANEFLGPIFDPRDLLARNWTEDDVAMLLSLHWNTLKSATPSIQGVAMEPSWPSSADPDWIARLLEDNRRDPIQSNEVSRRLPNASPSSSVNGGGGAAPAVPGPGPDSADAAPAVVPAHAD